jgi:putative hydrolase of the HAD superfamily
MSLPPALFLDLDDTILRFGAGGEGLWAELAGETAAALEIDRLGLVRALDEARAAYWSDAERSRAGRLDMRGARRTITAAAFAALGLRAPDAARTLADAFTWEREARVAPLPGAMRALAGFRARGVRLALLTNGSREFQRGKLVRFDLERSFDAIFIEGELGFGKPDARVFERALSALGVAPSETWMVGDNLEADIAGAQAVGIHAVWIDHRGGGVPRTTATRPDRVVRGLAELASPAPALGRSE